MPRGVTNNGGNYTTGTGQGGNHNFSVYDNSYDPFAKTWLPTNQGGDNQQSNPNPNTGQLGAGAVGQGTQGYNPWLNVDDYDLSSIDPFNTFDEGRRSGTTFQEIREGINNFISGIPDAASNFIQATPIWQIGKAIYDGTAMSATGDWLGSWADSPWNPLNWENGDPPEWSVGIQGVDGAPPTTIASGTFNSDNLLNQGYSQSNGSYSLASQGAEVGDTITTTGGGTVTLGGQKMPNPGDAGYIHYGTDPLNPEDLDIPAGSFFNYQTNQIESIQGDPYAYRRIDASNAWLNAGINDLQLTDEQWANATEEEKQANWEARQEAAKDIYNFGTQGADAFGAITNVGFDKDVSLLKEAYLNGDYTTTDLKRYYDGLRRSQEGESTTSSALGEYEELLADAGYTEEEIAIFSDSFEEDTLDFTGVRSKEGAFDVFENSVDTFYNEDADLGYTAYDLYDTKKDEQYTQTFGELDALTEGDTETFNEAYYALDIDTRNAYLSKLLSDGRIDEESYKRSVVSNLVKEGVVISQLEDGTYRTGNNIYEDYRVLEFPELEDKEYTQTEINYARRNGLDLEADYDTDSPTSFEQGSDEWNERRERIARLDAGNVRFSATVEGQEEPEKEEFWEGGLEDQLKGVIKTVGLDWLTSGLYSGVPAATNILKGEGNSEDWKAIAPVLLKSTGAITEDRGIGHLTPAETIGAVNAVIDQDLMAFATTVVTDEWLTSSLTDLGIPETVSSDPDFLKGLKKASRTYYSTGSIQQAMEDGFVKYVKEGGSFGDVDFNLNEGFDFDFDFPIDFDVSWLEDTIRSVGSFIDDQKDTIADAVSPIIDAADDVIDKVGDEVVDPALEVVKDTGSMIEDVVKDTGSAIDDAVIEPVKEVVEDTGSMIEDVVRDAGSAVDDAVIEPVKEFVENIEVPDIDIDLPEVDIDLPEVDIDLPSVDLDLPSVDLPSIDLPSVDLPSVDLPSLGLGLAMGGGTRTTDSLFSRELFKFKDKDFSLVELLTEDMPKEKPEEENLYDFNDDPFASTFDRNV